MEWKKVETYFNSETGDMTSNVPWGELLVSNGKFVEYVEGHGWDNGEYYFHNGTGKIKGITHFMTLPQPPQD